jgi:hypothetical protein
LVSCGSWRVAPRASVCLLRATGEGHLVVLDEVMSPRPCFDEDVVAPAVELGH